MLIVILGFLTSLLFTFALLMFLTREWAQATSELKVWREQHQQRLIAKQRLAQAKSDAAWQSNKEMVMY
jgi:hypothetical protein